MTRLYQFAVQVILGRVGVQHFIGWDFCRIQVRNMHHGYAGAVIFAFFKAFGHNRIFFIDPEDFINLRTYFSAVIGGIKTGGQAAPHDNAVSRRHGTAKIAVNGRKNNIAKHNHQRVSVVVAHRVGAQVDNGVLAIILSGRYKSIAGFGFQHAGGEIDVPLAKNRSGKEKQ